MTLWHFWNNESIWADADVTQISSCIRPCCDSNRKGEAGDLWPVKGFLWVLPAGSQLLRASGRTQRPVLPAQHSASSPSEGPGLPWSEPLGTTGKTQAENLEDKCVTSKDFIDEIIQCSWRSDTLKMSETDVTSSQAGSVIMGLNLQHYLSPWVCWTVRRWWRKTSRHTAAERCLDGLDRLLRDSKPPSKPPTYCKVHQVPWAGCSLRRGFPRAHQAGTSTCSVENRRLGFSLTFCKQICQDHFSFMLSSF